jgi:hypothetical protein
MHSTASGLFLLQMGQSGQRLPVNMNDEKQVCIDTEGKWAAA